MGTVEVRVPERHQFGDHRKASEEKAGKAMGIHDTKLSKLAQEHSSFNKNKAKKEKKQQHMREYRQKKMIKVNEVNLNPEAQRKIKAKRAADKKASRAYQKYAEQHNKFYRSKKDSGSASLQLKETKVFFNKATRKYFVAVERVKLLEKVFIWKGMQ